MKRYYNTYYSNFVISYLRFLYKRLYNLWIYRITDFNIIGKVLFIFTEAKDNAVPKTKRSN